MHESRVLRMRTRETGGRRQATNTRNDRGGGGGFLQNLSVAHHTKFFIEGKQELGDRPKAVVSTAHVKSHGRERHDHRKPHTCSTLSDQIYHMYCEMVYRNLDSRVGIHPLVSTRSAP